MRQLNNLTWVGFSQNVGKKVCNASPYVLFNIFNKMNSNLAYFDVSNNIEILQLSDSNEFENEINKQLERKIEPMEPTFEEVFAWSYKDMIGIDPKIAQHHIDTYAHMVPVKQKLRCMRTKWLLKIKEKVTK